MLYTALGSNRYERAISLTQQLQRAESGTHWLHRVQQFLWNDTILHSKEQVLRMDRSSVGDLDLPPVGRSPRARHQRVAVKVAVAEFKLLEGCRQELEVSRVRRETVVQPGEQGDGQRVPNERRELSTHRADFVLVLTCHLADRDPAVNRPYQIVCRGEHELFQHVPPPVALHHLSADEAPRAHPHRKRPSPFAMHLRGG